MGNHDSNDSFCVENHLYASIADAQTTIPNNDYKYYQPRTVVHYILTNPSNSEVHIEGDYTFEGGDTTIRTFVNGIAQELISAYTSIIADSVEYGQSSGGFMYYSPKDMTNLHIDVVYDSAVTVCTRYWPDGNEYSIPYNWYWTKNSTWYRSYLKDVMIYDSYTFAEPLILDFVYSGTSQLRISIAPGTYTGKTMDDAVASAFNVAIGYESMTSLEDGNGVHINTAKSTRIAINSITSPNFPQTLFRLVQIGQGFTDIYPEPVYPWVYKSIPNLVTIRGTEYQLAVRKWDTKVTVPSTVQTTSITGNGLLNKVVQLAYNCNIGVTQWNPVQGIDITMSKNVEFKFRNSANQVITPGFTNKVITCTTMSGTGTHITFPDTMATQVLEQCDIVYTLGDTVTTVNIDAGNYTQDSLIAAMNSGFVAQGLTIAWVKGVHSWVLRLNGGSISGTFLDTGLFGGIKRSSTVCTWVYAVSTNGSTEVYSKSALEYTPELDKYVCLVNSSSATWNSTMAKYNGSTFTQSAHIRYNAYKVKELVDYMMRMQSYRLFKADRTNFGNGWFNVSQSNYIDSYTWSLTGNASYNKLAITGGTVLNQVPFVGYTCTTPVASVSNRYTIYPQSGNYYMYIRDNSNVYYSVFFIPTTFEATAELNAKTMLTNGFRQAVPASNPSSWVNLWVDTSVESKWYQLSLETGVGCYYPAVYAGTTQDQYFPEHSGTLCGFISSSNTSFRFLNNFTFGVVNVKPYNVPLVTPVESSMYCFKDGYTGIYRNKAAYYNGDITNDVNEFRYLCRGLGITRARINDDNIGNIRYYYGLNEYVEVIDNGLSQNLGLITDTTGGAYRHAECAYRFITLLNIALKAKGSTRKIMYKPALVEGKYLLLEYYYTTGAATRYTLYKCLQVYNYSRPRRVPNAYWGTDRALMVLEVMDLVEESYFIGESETGIHWWSGPIYLNTGLRFTPTLCWFFSMAQVCFPVTNYTTGTASNFNWGITNAGRNDDSISWDTYLTVTNKFRLYWSYCPTSDPTTISTYYGTTTSNWLMFHGVETNTNYAGIYLHMPGETSTTWLTGRIWFYNSGKELMMNYNTKQCTSTWTGIRDDLNNDTAATTESTSNSITTRIYNKWNDGTMNIAGTTYNYSFNKYWLHSCLFAGMLARMLAYHYYTTSPSTYKPVTVTTCTHASYNSWSTTIACSNDFNIVSRTVTSGNSIVNAIPSAGVTTKSMRLGWSNYSGKNSFELIYYRTPVSGITSPDPILNYAPVVSLWNFTNLVDSFNFMQRCDTRTEYATAPILHLNSATKTNDYFEFVFNSSVLAVYSSSREPGKFQYSSVTWANYGWGAENTTGSMNLFNQKFIDICEIDANTRYDSAIKIYNTNYRLYNDTSYSFTPLRKGNTFLVNDLQMWDTTIDTSSDFFYNNKRGFYGKKPIYWNHYTKINGGNAVAAGFTDQPAGFYDAESILRAYSRILSIGVLHQLGPVQAQAQNINITYDSDLLRTSDIPEYPKCNTRITINQKTAGTVAIYMSGTSALVSNCYPMSYLGNDKLPSSYFSTATSSFNNIQGMFCTRDQAYIRDSYLYFTSNPLDSTKYYTMYIPMNGLYNTDAHKNLVVPMLMEAGKQLLKHANDSSAVPHDELMITNVTSTTSSVTYVFNRDIVPVYSVPTTSGSATIQTMFSNNIIERDINVTFPEQPAANSNFSVIGFEQSANKYTTDYGMTCVYHIYAEEYTVATPDRNTITVYIDPGYGIFNASHEYIPKFTSNGAVIDASKTVKQDSNNWLYLDTDPIDTSVTKVKYPLTNDCNTVYFNVDGTTKSYAIATGDYTWSEFVDALVDVIGDDIGCTNTVSHPSYIEFVTDGTHNWYFDRTQGTLQGYYWCKWYNMNTGVQSCYLEVPDTCVMNPGYSANDSVMIEPLFACIADAEIVLSNIDYEYYQQETTIHYVIDSIPIDESKHIEGDYKFSGKTTIRTWTTNLCNALNTAYSSILTNAFVHSIYKHDTDIENYVRIRPSNESTTQFSLTFDENMHIKYDNIGTVEYSFHANTISSWKTYLKDLMIYDYTFIEPLVLYFTYKVNNGIRNLTIEIPAGQYTLTELNDTIVTVFNTAYGKNSTLTAGNYSGRGRYMNTYYSNPFVNNVTITSLNYPNITFDIIVGGRSCSDIFLNPAYPNALYKQLPNTNSTGVQTGINKWDQGYTPSDNTYTQTIEGNGLLNKIVQLAYNCNIGVTNWVVSNGGIDITMAKNVQFDFRNSANQVITTPSFVSKLLPAATVSGTHVTISNNVYQQEITNDNCTITYTKSTTSIPMNVPTGYYTQQKLIATLNSLFLTNSVPVSWTNNTTGYTLVRNGCTLSGSLTTSDFFGASSVFTGDTDYNWVYNSSLNNVTSADTRKLVSEQVPELDRYLCLVNSDATSYITDNAKGDASVTQVQGKVKYDCYCLKDLVAYFTRMQSYGLYKADTANFKANNAWYLLQQWVDPGATVATQLIHWAITGNASYNKLCIEGGTLLKQIPFINAPMGTDAKSQIANGYTLSSKWDNYYMYTRTSAGVFYTVEFNPVFDCSFESNCIQMLTNGFASAVPVITGPTVKLVSSITSNSAYYTITMTESLGIYYPVVRKNNLAALDNFVSHTGTLCGFIDKSSVYHWLNNFTFSVLDTATFPKTYTNATQYCFKTPFGGVYGSNSAYYNQEINTSNATNLKYFNRGYNISRATMNIEGTNINWYLNQRDYFQFNDDSRTYPVFSDPTGGAWHWNELNVRCLVLMNQLFAANSIDRIIVYDINGNDFNLFATNKAHASEPTSYTKVDTNYFGHANPFRSITTYTAIGNISKNESLTHSSKEPKYTTQSYFIGETSDGTKWWSGPVDDSNHSNGNWYDWRAEVTYSLIQAQTCFAIDNYTLGDAPIFNWGVTGFTGIKNYYGSTVTFTNPFLLYWSYPMNPSTNISEYYGTIQSNWLLFNGIEERSYDFNTYLHMPDIEESDKKYFTNSMVIYENERYMPLLFNYKTKIAEIYKNYTGTKESITADTIATIETNSDNTIQTRVYHKWSGSITVNGSSISYPFNKYWICTDVFAGMPGRMIAKKYLETSPTTWKPVYTQVTHPTGNVWQSSTTCANSFTINGRNGGTNAMINSIPSGGVTGTAMNLQWGVYSGNSTYMMIYYKTNYNTNLSPFVVYGNICNTWNTSQLTQWVDAFATTRLCDTRSYNPSVPLLRPKSITYSNDATSTINIVMNSGCQMIYSLTYEPRLFRYFPIDKSLYGNCAGYTSNLAQTYYIDYADTTNASINPMSTSIKFVDPKCRGTFDATSDHSYVLVYNGSSYVEPTFRTYYTITETNDGMMSFIRHQPCMYLDNKHPWTLYYRFNVSGVTTADQTFVTNFPRGFYSLENMLKTLARNMSTGILRTLTTQQCFDNDIYMACSGDIMNKFKFNNYPFNTASIIINQNNANHDAVKLKLAQLSLAYPFPVLNLWHKIPTNYFNSFNSNFSQIGHNVGARYDQNNASYRDIGGYLYFTTGTNDPNKIYKLFVSVAEAYDTTWYKDKVIDYLLLSSNATMLRAIDNTPVDSNELCILGATSTTSSVSFIFNKSVESIFSIPTTSVTSDAIKSLFGDKMVISTFSYNTTTEAANARTYNIPGLEMATYEYVIANNEASYQGSNVYHVHAVDYNSARPVDNTITVCEDIRYGYFNANKVYKPKFNSDGSIIDTTVTEEWPTNKWLFKNNDPEDMYVTNSKYTLTSDRNKIVVHNGTTDTTYSIPPGNYTWDQFTSAVATTIGTAIGLDTSNPLTITNSYTLFNTSGTNWYFNRSHSDNSIQNYSWTKYYNLNTSIQTRYLECPDSGILGMSYSVNDNVILDNNGTNNDNKVFVSIVEPSKQSTLNNREYTFAEPLIIDIAYHNTTGTAVYRTGVLTIPAGYYSGLELVTAIANAYNELYGEKTCTPWNASPGGRVVTGFFADNAWSRVTSFVPRNYPQTLVTLRQGHGKNKDVPEAHDYTDINFNNVYPQVYTLLTNVDTEGNIIPSQKWDSSAPMPPEGITQTTAVSGTGILNKIVQLCYNCNIPVTNWVVSSGGIDITMSKDVKLEFRNSSNQVVTPAFTTKVVSQDTTTGATHITFYDTKYKQAIAATTVVYTKNSIVTTINVPAMTCTQQYLIGYLNGLFARYNTGLTWVKTTSGYQLNLNSGTMAGTLWNQTFFNLNSITKTSTMYTWGYKDCLNNTVTNAQTTLVDDPVPDLDRFICLVNKGASVFTTAMTKPSNQQVFTSSGHLVYDVCTLSNLVPEYARIQSYNLYKTDTAGFKAGSSWFNVTTTVTPKT